jgi:hypothetical protein
MRHALMIALSALLVPAVGMAQDIQDLDGDSGDKSSKRTARDFESEVIREVERGYYLKANVGSPYYLVNRADGVPLFRPVVSVGFAVGSDFVDNESLSVAWEAAFSQSLMNGPKLEELTSAGPFSQGDVHTFAGLANVEVSFYPMKRLGIGIRAGGGVMVMPLLMAEPYYTDEIITALWGGVVPQVHNGALPLAFGGPTIEYYTKLSHFSLGLEGDVSYVIGLGLGVHPTGYLKYTF